MWAKLQQALSSQILDAADVHSASMELEGGGDPAPATALDAWPVEVTQASFTMCTRQLALYSTFFHWVMREQPQHIKLFPLLII